MASLHLDKLFEHQHCQSQGQKSSQTKPLGHCCSQATLIWDSEGTQPRVCTIPLSNRSNGAIIQVWIKMYSNVLH